MKKVIHNILLEELESSDKTQIKKLAKDEFAKLLKGSEFRSAVDDIIRKQIKGDNKTEKEIAKITQKVLVKLYKTFWTRRSFWSNNLENI